MSILGLMTYLHLSVRNIVQFSVFALSFVSMLIGVNVLYKQKNIINLIIG